MAQTQLNLARLAKQGRAYDATRPWTGGELKKLLTLIKECDLARDVAADYMRNGIDTPAKYEKAQEAGFEPKSMEDLQKAAVEAHLKEVHKSLGVEEDDESESKKAPAKKTTAKKTATKKAASK